MTKFKHKDSPHIWRIPASGFFWPLGVRPYLKSKRLVRQGMYSPPAKRARTSAYVTPSPMRRRQSLPAVRRRSSRRYKTVRKRRYGSKRRSNWKVRARREVGKPIRHTVPTKCANIASVMKTNAEHGILGAARMTTIPFGTNVINRDTNRVELRGLRFLWYLRNLQTSPTVFNLAIVAPKSNETTSLTNANFFRGTFNRGTNLDRGTHNGLTLTYRSINTDLYSVLYRKRVWLNGVQAAGGLQINSGSMKMMKKYLPVKREIQFNNDADTDPSDGNVWMVWWFSIPDSVVGQTTGDTGATVAQFSYQSWVFFKDA